MGVAVRAPDARGVSARQCSYLPNDEPTLSLSSSLAAVLGSLNRPLRPLRGGLP